MSLSSSAIRSQSIQGLTPLDLVVLPGTLAGLWFVQRVSTASLVRTYFPSSSSPLVPPLSLYILFTSLWVSDAYAGSVEVRNPHHEHQSTHSPASLQRQRSFGARHALGPCSWSFGVRMDGETQVRYYGVMTVLVEHVSHLCIVPFAIPIAYRDPPLCPIRTIS